MNKLDEANYANARPLFQSLGFHLNSHAVLDGTSWGSCWVDDANGPKSAFLSSPESTYLAGDPDNVAFNASLNEALMNRTLLGQDATVFSIVASSQDWFGALKRISQPRTPIAVDRRHYVCTKTKLDWRSHVPEGFSVVPIDHALLNRDDVDVPKHVHSWMKFNWESVPLFLEKAFGRVTLHDKKVVSWSLADCVTADSCEIGIHTADDYRRQGLATLTVAATVEHALSHGFRMVGWHCDEDNLGSSGTAEKVGFTRERDYKMHYLFLEEADELAERGYASFKAGRYQETADGYERMFEIREDSPDYLYHVAARAWGALGNHQKALEYLGKAIERGWRGASHTLNCVEFSTLHDTSEWENLLRRMDAQED